VSWTVRAAFGLFLAAAVILVAQLWSHFLDPDTFVKTMITLGVAFAVIVAWNLVLRERRDSARLRDKSRLD
jgi:hypothetical protein